MVGFCFLDTAVLGVPVPLHGAFEEVNLRFYVRRRVGGELRRGVAFIKEIVPRRAVTWVANNLYHEHYVTLPMRHQVTDRSVRYEWRHAGASCHLAAVRLGEPALPHPDSEGRFIVEHYHGYVAQPDGSTLEYRVAHPPWRLWRAAHPELTCDVAALYGEPFASAVHGAPSSCLIAEGSAVEVSRGIRL
jgi:uncharacterized protein YqjF (DUF2071 family)